MKTVRFTLVGTSPISFGKAVQSDKMTGESADDFEKRTWRERMHVDKDGEVFIPAMAIKNCLADCAKFLSESVPGKGKATYTKHFEAGTMSLENVGLGIKAASVEPERLFVPADGRKGGSKRVWRYFPYIPEGWTGTAEVLLLDPLLISKPEKVEEYAHHAGKFIGIGRWRPRNGGTNGRFLVEGFEVL